LLLEELIGKGAVLQAEEEVLVEWEEEHHLVEEEAVEACQAEEEAVEAYHQAGEEAVEAYHQAGEEAVVEPRHCINQGT